ncbi:MAG: S1C family serine protease [Lachnospiraceae bacterium]|nr:S1C family serine protease [Lachnospiraceae bacterium]
MKKEEKTEEKKIPETVEAESNDYDFIREKIKDRPINRKKLLRRTLLTAGMAVIFGLIACITFLLLEPVFGKLLNSDQSMDLRPVELNESTENEQYPTETVQIIDEEREEGFQIAVEKPLDEMSLNDDDIVLSGNAAHGDGHVSGNAASGMQASGQVQGSNSENEIELEDYRQLYRKKYSLSVEVSKSLVTITANEDDTNWTDENALREHMTTGVLVGENGYQLLILADSSRIGGNKPVDNMRVKFSNGDTSDGVSLLRYDRDTGLAVYAIQLSDIPTAAREGLKMAVIGASSTSTVLGNAVIAAGMPLGSESVCYGAVTSTGRTGTGIDCSYQLLTTDIYGSTCASGVLTNMKGQLVGVICNGKNEDGLENMICAYGISGIRSLIEDLSNNVDRAYLGIYPAEVKSEAKKEYDIPDGVYITDVEIDSPAMQAGLLRGDILISIDGTGMLTVGEYMTLLRGHKPEDTVRIVYARSNGSTYVNMTADVELGFRPDN